MDDETDPSEGLAPASIFLFGREFEIGPLHDGEKFDLHAQLRDARRELLCEFNDLDMGHRPSWMSSDESIDDALMVMRMQLKILQAILDQVPDPNPGGGGITD